MVPPHGWLPMGDPRVMVLLDQAVGYELPVDQMWDVCRAAHLIDGVVSIEAIFDEE
ncbi:MAG: hypothetical protein U0599_16840 [Vicinamibacteria bacterium]